VREDEEGAMSGHNRREFRVIAEAGDVIDHRRPRFECRFRYGSPGRVDRNGTDGRQRGNERNYARKLRIYRDARRARTRRFSANIYPCRARFKGRNSANTPSFYRGFCAIKEAIGGRVEDRHHRGSAPQSGRRGRGKLDGDHGSGP
jgi:hypothetical protein